MARTVIKLGSAIVATDDGELRAEVLERICAAVAAARDAGEEVVIVTSGAIARGTRMLGLAGRPSAIEELQAASAVGQGRLYREYDELLAGHGALAAQVLLTFSDVSTRTSYLNARQTLGKLLDWGAVPVINENDTTATDEITFGDNDFLAAQVAILLGADRLVILTSVDGLYDSDPRSDAAATLIERVDDFAALEELTITQTTSAHGSGGMRSKVVAADMATAAGIATVICNGEREGVLAATLAGEPRGTFFAPRKQRYSSFKLWLRYAKPSRGTIVVDAGAARALREDGTSLLPVGVVEVRGSFDEGDAVDVVEADALIGKGICNYAAEDLRQVAGHNSAAVRERFPRAVEEAVHRDYFVLA
ncbi:MAG TPA: glutamate 5-kinase [Solirubrobacteraceae bacterium]|jgi:glutamate 5-kinase|nr:glutamate 5-kinase [Solirubrobacteraceae bacterium]